MTPAVRASEVGKRATHHGFAARLPEADDIRAVRDRLGRDYASTTMIDTHVLKKGGLGVCSPLDG